MSTTFIIFLVLIAIVAFLLVVVIMVQNPKGGGLSSSFGGGGTQQLGGVQKTTDFLDKATWGLATLLLVLILLSNIAIPAYDNQSSDATVAEPGVTTPVQNDDLLAPDDATPGTDQSPE
ncbi:MAG: preprotein translocase subunit SecG [Dokdonia sp.]|jgi:preprotein translocase subunit SecG